MFSSFYRAMKTIALEFEWRKQIDFIRAVMGQSSLDCTYHYVTQNVILGLGRYLFWRTDIRTFYIIEWI